MKKLIITLTVYLLFTTPHLHAQSWQWAKSAGSNSYDYPTMSTTDKFGNVYIVGEFGGSTITFGTTTLSNTSGGMAPSYMIFIVKYNSFGNVLWAKTANAFLGGIIDANSITTDSLGNVFITGDFVGDSISFGGSKIYNTGSYRLFLVKFDSLGNFIYSKIPFGICSSSGRSITTDNNGNIYVTGDFYGGNIIFDTCTLINYGSTEMLLVKFNSLGNVIWAKNSIGTNIDYGNCITSDTSGNIYVAGNFKSSNIAFGSNTLSNSGLLGTSDIFFVKYDTNGNVLWAKNPIGNDNDNVYSIGTDTHGNIYMTGIYSSTSITFGSTILTNATNSNIYVAKFNSSGIPIWAKSPIGGTGNGSFSHSIISDNYDNIYICGRFNSANITFDSFTVSNVNGTLFIVKYNSSGSVIWGLGANDSSNAGGISLSLDNSNNLYVFGTFISHYLNLGSYTLTLYDDITPQDIFIAKLNTELSNISNMLSDFNGNIIVYPNPTNCIISIKIPTFLNNINITINDIYGNVFQPSNITVISDKVIQININNLHIGEYIINVNENDKYYNAKIIIK